MLLTITTTHQPATDLGYLLAKHPDKAKSFELAYGQAHVFYPRADDEECTACLRSIRFLDSVWNQTRAGDGRP